MRSVGRVDGGAGLVGAIGGYADMHWREEEREREERQKGERGRWASRLKTEAGGRREWSASEVRTRKKSREEKEVDVPPNRLPARCCSLQPNYSLSNESAGQSNDGPQRQAAACTRQERRQQTLRRLQEKRSASSSSAFSISHQLTYLLLSPSLLQTPAGQRGTSVSSSASDAQASTAAWAPTSPRVRLPSSSSSPCAH